MVFWSILALSAAPEVMAVTAGVLVLLHAVAGTRIRRMRKALLFWVLMAGAIIISSGLGDAGVLAGAIRSARLLTVLLAGQLLASTTDPADLAGALRRLTAVLPSSWSGTLATAVSLTLAFIPRLLDEGATVRDAAFSRGLGERKSILRRSLSLGLPLAEATLRGADTVSEALLSRCYVDNPTPPDLKITKNDLYCSLLGILPPLAAWFLFKFL
jgi:energy-coupling factor transporter transmembrane protein EcfT